MTVLERRCVKGDLIWDSRFSLMESLSDAIINYKRRIAKEDTVFVA